MDIHENRSYAEVFNQNIIALVSSLANNQSLRLIHTNRHSQLITQKALRGFSDAVTTSGNNCIFKEFFGSVVRFHMTDNEIVKLVWEVMVLKRRFEDNPYSLSLKQVELLKDHENRRYIWHYVN